MEADDDDVSRKKHQQQQKQPSSCSPEDFTCTGGGGMTEELSAETVVVGDGFVGREGGYGNVVTETIGVVEAVERAGEREAIDEGMGEGVVGAVDGVVGVGDAEVAIASAEEEKGLETGGDDEIEMEEDVVVAEAGESGGFGEQNLGIGDQAVEKAELAVSEGVMKEDVGDADVAVEEEEEEVGIETFGGCHNESGGERKEDVAAVVADAGECREFDEHVGGICDEEAAEKAELMESGDVRKADVGVADVAKEEEDPGVCVNGEEVIEDGGIDDDVTTEGRDDVVTADVVDSLGTKEEEGVAMVVEGDVSAMVEEQVMDVGSHDVGSDREVIELKENEIENVTDNDSFRNGESMGGTVSLAVEESGISDFKGQVSLAENEVVTDGGGESMGLVPMADEIAMDKKDIDESYAVINAEVIGVMVKDEKETVDRIGVGEEKELVAAEVVVMSDDATAGPDETNKMENADSTEDGDNEEVGDAGAEIDAEAVENDGLEDKDMDDVEERQATKDVYRTEETDATEDNVIAEKEMEQVEQREINVLLNRKGGRSSKEGMTSTKKKLEEDVCFICFDGGDLVLCDRRWGVLSLSHIFVYA